MEAVDQNMNYDHDMIQSATDAKVGTPEPVSAPDSKDTGKGEALNSDAKQAPGDKGRSTSAGKEHKGKRKCNKTHDGGTEEQPSKKQDVQKKVRFPKYLPFRQPPETLHDAEFKFASLLTASTLEAEVHQLRRCTTERFDWDEVQDKADALVQAREDLTRSPFDPGALETAFTISQGCKTMGEMQSSMSLSTRIARLHAIDARVRLWRWLDGDVRTSVVDRLNGEATDDGFALSWVARLADAVGVVYSTRSAKKMFHPAEFGVTSNLEGLVLQPYTLVNNHQGRYPPCGGELAHLVGSSVVLIVSSWMGGHSDIEQKQAWFVDAIANRLGEEALTLDLTWNMFRNFKPIYVLPQDQAYKRHIGDSLLGPFLSTLQTHPIMEPDSREGKLYSLYCDVINERRSALDIMEPLLDISPTWPKFKRMLELSLGYLDNPTGAFQDRYQAKLKDEEDYYLPFRNDAISRRRSMANGGPYVKETIREVRGVFSAVVWRACTYRSGFSQDIGMVFDGWTDLDRKIEGVIALEGGKMTKVDTYFCKKDAYGQPAGRRSIELAATYWETLQELNWEGFSSSNPTFSKCMEFFRPPGKNHSKRFPQLRALGSFMLVGDLACAGICQPLTDHEAATYIVENSMGSLAGLRLLGLGPEDGLKGRDQVDPTKRGLQELYDLVNPLLVQLGYTGELDFVLLEHMLCKFQRALDQKLI
ncbi:hypothetical protein BKA70DRAFT_1449334 [Coprinopsis sp. MPI-PUGE-AT-0042]|nr:hypothetical protein BKA70DRAFT_1449334 [Coprinopsis sp. MPI-PUGE-AT-0042]